LFSTANSDLVNAAIMNFISTGDIEGSKKILYC